MEPVGKALILIMIYFGDKKTLHLCEAETSDLSGGLVFVADHRVYARLIFLDFTQSENA